MPYSRLLRKQKVCTEPTARMWSDGVTRSSRYLGNEAELAIIEYFETAREERYLELKWENEQLKLELERRKREDERWSNSKPKVMVARAS